MKSQYIADDEVIIQTQGLRWVKKGDTRFPSSECFTLTWDFKGSNATHTYKDKGKRDAIFDRLVEAFREEGK
jgi:hypothetical protein